MAFPFLDRSQPGVWLSGAAHGALLLAGIMAFTAAKLPDAQEGIPVEVMTENQFSEITRGETTAAKVQPVPSPRVDRQAEVKVERDPGEATRDVPAPPKRPAEVKIADQDAEPAATPPPRPDLARQELAKAEAAKAEAAKADAAKAEAAKAQAARAEAARAEAAKAEMAKAETAKAEALKLALRQEAEDQARAEEAERKAEAQAKAEAARSAARAKAEAEAKAELDRKVKAELAKAEADAKSKAEADAKAKALADAKAKETKALAQAKAKQEAEAKARRQAEAADKFSPGDISKLLASKEPAASSGSTGREVQKTASLGTQTGTAQRLNPSQRDQIAGLIREQLIKCWQPPVAVQSAAKPPTAVIRLAIRQDGSLLSEPSLVNSSADPLFRPVADSALRATRRCAPLRIPDKFAPFYQDWKDLVVDFDPREIG